MGDGPGNLFDFQALPPLSSTKVHLVLQEVWQRWQDASMDEEGPHNKTWTLKRKLTKGRRIMLLRRDTGQCMSMQRWGKEFQSPPGVQSVEEHVRQQEGLLQVP